MIKPFPEVNELLMTCAWRAREVKGTVEKEREPRDNVAKIYAKCEKGNFHQLVDCQFC